jgi:hypothetical protein
MKKNRVSLIEILLIECLFFFAFFAVLSYLNMGSPRLFFIVAVVLLVSYLLIGIARYIEVMNKEEAAWKNVSDIRQ